LIGIEGLQWFGVEGEHPSPLNLAPTRGAWACRLLSLNDLLIAVVALGILAAGLIQRRRGER
jgi:hypothetical protein